jgi:hypothetical protein
MSAFLRTIAVLCFIISGISLAGAAMLIVNGLEEGAAYITGTVVPALFFLLLGIVFNHFASKFKARKLAQSSN